MLVLALGPPPPAHAIGEILLDAGIGESFPQSSNLSIEQRELDNDFTIRDLAFDDRSLDDPPFYFLGASYFLRAAPWVGFTLDFVHAKLYARTEETKRIDGTISGTIVDEPTPVQAVVQSFSISHGLNYLALGVAVRKGLGPRSDAWPIGRVQVQGGVGVGPVLGHPENTVGGERLRERYDFGGVGFVGSATIRVFPFSRVGVWLAALSTISSIDVPVARGGHASFTDRTPSVLLGLTYRATTPVVAPSSPLSPPPGER